MGLHIVKDLKNVQGVMENELGLLTDEDIYKVMKDEICNDKYIDLQGIGTATKAVTAAKAGAWAGSAALIFN